MSFKDLPDDLEPESLEDPIKPKRAKVEKKAPESALTTEKLRSLYTRVKPVLPLDERRYVEDVLEGKVQVDPVLEMRILVRQMSLVFSESAAWHLMEGKISRDFAAFGNNLRMAISDLYAIEQKERERAKEVDKLDNMVQLTEKGAEMDRLETILREISVD